MESKWYEEYKMVPYGPGIDSELYLKTMRLLHTFDRFGIVKVKPMYLARAHDVVNIVVDEVVYDEPMLDWIGRFQR